MIPPLKLAHANNAFEMESSDVFSFCPWSQKLPKEVPVPIFGLSCHQMEEKKIFAESNDNCRWTSKLVSAVFRAERNFKVKISKILKSKSKSKEIRIYSVLAPT